VGDALDLSHKLRIHLVGAGGSGMSAIAEVLLGMGHDVTGSDLHPSAALGRLRSLGARVALGHAPSNVGDADLVAVSSAVGATNDANPEVAEARRLGVPVLRRSEILAAIGRIRRVVAVSGTHGKTTTSAMLALALSEGGLDPSFVVGAPITGVGTGARWGSGEWMVVEADESDGTFLELGAAAAVVTSVEPDHLGHYGSFEALVSAFRAFLERVDGPRVVCADDVVALGLAAETGAATYGTSKDSTYVVETVELRPTGTSFRLSCPEGRALDLSLPAPGLHNALNAAGAATMALQLGVAPDAVRRSLESFPGVARRFQWRGEAGGVTFVDDYAHLPTEVRAALATAKLMSQGRIVCVFQPHRYSRTGDLAGDFAGAFAGADLLAVTEIYSAGETPRPGVSGKLIVDAVLDADPFEQVAWMPDRTSLVAFLRSRLRPGDLCLTLGAGDLTTLPDELLK
jgi:UDP-N-acetylmuramate--alanine ligase